MPCRTMKRIVAIIVLFLTLQVKSRDLNLEQKVTSSVSSESFKEKLQWKFSDETLNNKSFCLLKIGEKKNSFHVFGCVTAVLVTFAILSTIYDLKTKEINEQNRNQSVLAFSLYKNWKSLFNLKQNNQTDVIECLSGIRVVSTFSIIFLHSVFFRIFPLTIRDETIFKAWLGFRTASSVSALNITVDSFFVISATLATKSMLKDLEQ